MPIYTREFANDPHRIYRYMRERYGTLVPVWIADGVKATLVIGYHTAVRILQDPHHFPADPRPWQRKVPADLDILPMVEWRPNALRSNGNSEAHVRYRKATSDALAGVNQYELVKTVQRTAHTLIKAFCADGSADLIESYIAPLPFMVLNEMVGCPPDIGARIAEAAAELFESQDTAATNQKLNRALWDINKKKKYKNDC
jgi:cytochrome P450